MIMFTFGRPNWNGFAIFEHLMIWWWLFSS